MMTPAAWIAAHRPPGDEVIAEDQDEPEPGQHPTAGVEDLPPEQHVLCRRIDRALGKRGDHREALTRRQTACRLDGQHAVAADAAAPVGAEHAEPAGVSGPANGARTVGEEKAVAHRIDREIPEIAGDVPVEFRLAVEPADLPAGAVAQSVGVVAARDDRILVADIDADGAVPAFGVIALRHAVAADVENAERNLAQGAARVLEGERKVTIDAVSDLRAFRLDADGFDDGEFAVLGDPHGRLEAMDDFCGRRAAGDQ